MAQKIRVLLVDDHSLIRSALRLLFERDPCIEIVHECASVQEVRQTQSVAHKWDVVLLDLSLRDGSGLDLVEELSLLGKVIVLTMHVESAYLARAVALGASGFLVKDSSPEDLIAIVKRVFNGERLYFGRAQENLVPFELLPQRSNDIALCSSSSPIHLSDREAAVIRLLCDGYGLTEMAKILNVSVKTIFTYRTRVLKKSGATSNAELVAKVVRGEIQISSQSQSTQV